MTNFQKRIRDYLIKQPRAVDVWEIAQQVFPEKWEKRSGRGALTGHVSSACVTLKAHHIPGEGIHTGGGSFRLKS